MAENPQEKPHFYGHRQRLKDKFASSDGAALADYEMLELLLTYAIPRRDTKPIAKELLTRFGNIQGVFSAELEQLCAVDGIGQSVAVYLRAISAAHLRARKSKVIGKKVMESKLELLDYLYGKIADLKHEEFHVIYLDSKNNIVADTMLFRGTINESAVYPREIVRMALNKGAASLVLVHNHPSGDPEPSPADEYITMEIVAAAAAVGITVHDHLIIGQNRHYSFYDHGKM